MGAYKHMSELYPDLVEIARAFNYPASSVCILTGDEKELRKSYPGTYANLVSCSHHRDWRTPFGYGQDLVASWLFEDMLMRSLSDAGLTVSGAGADKNREVLDSSRVSASSDCLVSYNGKTRLLELMSDYTGYWTKYGKMDLRDDKFRKMQVSSSLFLGISTIDNKYILLDMGGEYEATYIEKYSPYGNKPVYSIKLPEDKMKNLDFTRLAVDIRDMI